jgi:hypothetical protein
LAGSTTVLTDEKEIIEAIRKFQAGTTKVWCACVDHSLPSFSVSKVKEGYLAAKSGRVRIMYITEITRENLRYCREIIEFAELRHLDGLRGNFAVSDTEYVAGVKRGDLLVRLVRSDERELVHQQRHVFDTLWRQAAPVEERIRQLLL